MDKMFWFGWFLKGRCEVTRMDDLMLTVEIFGLLFLVGGIWYGYLAFKQRKP